MLYFVTACQFQKEDRQIIFIFCIMFSHFEVFTHLADLEVIRMKNIHKNTLINKHSNNIILMLLPYEQFFATLSEFKSSLMPAGITIIIFCKGHRVKCLPA